MAQPSKDTIYIDIDDEITSIIDKVVSSDKKIVALVLPKRAAVLQSVVNMKLLKRSADEANKSLVLITSESGLLPLAGVVGMHVAKTLQSKPAIPVNPQDDDAPQETDQSDNEDTELDTSKPVGELADDESIVVDNDEPEPDVKPKAKKGDKKKFKIPNFDKFRTRVVLISIGLALFITFLIFATRVWPKATVIVKTEASSISAELVVNADTTATELNEEDKVVPSIKKEIEKTDTEKVAATGEKNVGTKATGSVTLSVDCGDVDSFPLTVPAGTAISTSNLTFITNKSISLTTPGGGGGCTFNGSGDVTAQNPGDQYNVKSGSTFAVSGYSAVSGSNSSAMTGGTTKNVKVVKQEDVDAAKQSIADKNKEVKDELKAELEESGYVALLDTFVSGKENIVTSPKVGEEAAEVTVTSTVVYGMTGMKRDDLKKLIEKSIADKIDTSKQVILDDGIATATVKVSDLQPNGSAKVQINTRVLSGAQQDENAIKLEIAGKKKNESLSAIKARPGVTDAEITYSPFWVSSTPRNTAKITVIFEQNTSDADNNQ